MKNQNFIQCNKFVVIFLFTKDYKKVLMVKRNKPPYKNCWNGIGGKIEGNETEIQASIRECFEETGIRLSNPKLLLTYIYPEASKINAGTNLSVLYDFADEVPLESNYEGVYEWKDIKFALDFNNKELAGLANISQFIKEILDIEGIQKFYEQKV